MKKMTRATKSVAVSESARAGGKSKTETPDQDRWYQVRVVYRTELRTGTGVRTIEEHTAIEWRDRKKEKRPREVGARTKKRLHATWSRISDVLKGGQA